MSRPLLASEGDPLVLDQLKATFKNSLPPALQILWGLDEDHYWKSLEGLAIYEEEAAQPINVFMLRSTGLGIMGEILGLLEFKHQQQGKGSQIILEEEYKNSNKGSLPDALAYSVDGDRLLITGILESKTGNSKYDRHQLKGMLALWLKDGISIKGKNFKNIFFLMDGNIIPLTTIDAPTLKNVFFVSRSFDYENTRNRTGAFAEHEKIRREDAVKIVNLIIYFQLPQLEAYLREKKAWPQKGEPWFDWINRRGGQKELLFKLSEETKKALGCSGSLKALL